MLLCLMEVLACSGRGAAHVDAVECRYCLVEVLDGEAGIERGWTELLQAFEALGCLGGAADVDAFFHWMFHARSRTSQLSGVWKGMDRCISMRRYEAITG